MKKALIALVTFAACASGVPRLVVHHISRRDLAGLCIQGRIGGLSEPFCGPGLEEGSLTCLHLGFWKKRKPHNSTTIV